MSLRILAVAAASCLAGIAGTVGYLNFAAPAGLDVVGPPTPKASAAVSVSVAEVGPRAISAILELTGSLVPSRRTVLVSEVDGRIRSIPDSVNEITFELDGARITQALRLDMGQPVKKGSLIVQIDRGEYELRLRAAEAAKAKVERDAQELLSWRRPEEIRKLRAGVTEARAQLENAQAELRRQQMLLQQSATARSEYERAATQVKLFQGALDRSEAELEIAEKGPTKEQIAVAQAAIELAEAEVAVREDELGKTSIVAPYDAVITDRYVDEGEYVTAMPRVELMELMDLQFLVAQVGIPERHLNRVASGDEVKVLIEGANEPVRGVVFLINGKVEPDTRTYRARVGIDNRQGRFKAGQFARVEFVIGAVENALAVPSRAVVYTGGQPQVFVLQDGRARLTAIRPGIADDQYTEALSGLATGAAVIVDDPSILADGMLVRVRDAGASAAESR